MAPTAARTALYGTAFLGAWVLLALAVRRLDGALGFGLPGWAPVAGVAFLVGGGALALACAATFVRRGEGTPAPFDPPRRFVATGPYRWVRNPMYLGGLGLLAGLGLCLRSPAILALLVPAAGLAAHLFVTRVEEPGLAARFGEEYRRYRRRVRRWLPRPPPGDLPSGSGGPRS